MEYDIDWGEKLLETDLEDILDAKINLSYKDYNLTKDDYFMGCKSMLTSEKAALARVRMIYKDLKKRKVKKFLDVDFGPKDKNDQARHKLSLYKDGNPPQKGYVLPEEVEWVYGEELCDPGEKVQFVDDGASSNDCK